MGPADGLNISPRLDRVGLHRGMPLSARSIALALFFPSRILYAQVTDVAESVAISGQIVSRGTPLGGAVIHVRGTAIEAIEIYKGPSELPADSRGRGCGAIYLWLRNGT